METKENLENIRHSLAHLLAAAVLEIWPETKLTIGPAIENGFYYDFDLPSPISDKDLAKIEKKMREILKTWDKFQEIKVAQAEAKKIFKDNPYKAELIDEIAAKKEPVTLYKSGNFSDLCRGGHAASAKNIKPDSFKLSRVAGAYWRGNEKNKMLTRIYGLAFENKKELEDYIKRQEEAEKRDHRVLAEKLELFMISEEVGKGLPLWLPKGAFIRKKLENYMYDKEYAWGYKYVYTPILTRKQLYETSGHLAHYREDMYNPIDIEGEEYYLKPMNCPHHHMIFKHKLRSYKDLPLRLAEFGLIHRFERSGVLTGLIRARCFTQNDSHIYCRKNQLTEEILRVLELIKEVYKDFNIKNYWFRLSLPDPKDEKKYGDIKDKKMWEEAAQAARNALKNFGEKCVEAAGEASFYGPKIDIQIKNVFGKEDTIATCQVDFYSPKRFNLSFINDKGEKEPPVIIHRAIMGSFERFFAFLTEQTAGAFPLWLSPTQARILPIGEQQIDYAKKVLEFLKENNIRAELDGSNESLGKKIRAAKLEKIPYALIIGKKETESQKITAESRDKGNLGQFSVKDFAEKLKQEIADKK